MPRDGFLWQRRSCSERCYLFFGLITGPQTESTSMSRSLRRDRSSQLPAGDLSAICQRTARSWFASAVF